MGMTTEGIGRVRWVRILVVVLALTASRNNFPISGWTFSLKPQTSKAFSAKSSKNPKKYEGVTPSRRCLESRRTNWLSGGNSAPDFPCATIAQFTEADWAVPAVSPLQWKRDLISTSRSDPLALFLRTSHVSSLPPPI
jgi:hypothetical protein